MPKRTIAFLERRTENEVSYFIPELSYLSYNEKIKQRIERLESTDLSVINAVNTLIAALKPNQNVAVTGEAKTRAAAITILKNFYGNNYWDGISQGMVRKKIQVLYTALETLNIALPPPVAGEEMKFWLGLETPGGEWRRSLAHTFGKPNGLPPSITFPPLGWRGVGTFRIDVADLRPKLQWCFSWLNRLVGIIVAIGMGAVFVLAAAQAGWPYLCIAAFLLALVPAQYVEKEVNNTRRFARFLQFFKTNVSKIYGVETFKLVLQVIYIIVLLTAMDILSAAIFNGAFKALGIWWFAKFYAVILTLYLSASLIDSIFVRFGFNRRLPPQEWTVDLSAQQPKQNECRGPVLFQVKATDKPTLHVSPNVTPIIKGATPLSSPNVSPIIKSLPLLKMSQNYRHRHTNNLNNDNSPSLDEPSSRNTNAEHPRQAKITP